MTMMTERRGVGKDDAGMMTGMMITVPLREMYSACDDDNAAVVYSVRRMYVLDEITWKYTAQIQNLNLNSLQLKLQVIFPN